MFRTWMTVVWFSQAPLVGSQQERGEKKGVNETEKRSGILSDPLSDAQRIVVLYCRFGWRIGPWIWFRGGLTDLFLCFQVGGVDSGGSR